MPATSWQLNGNDASTLPHSCQQWPMPVTSWQLNGNDASKLPHSCQQWPMPVTSWQLNSNDHPHCHIVASNDQCGNFVATDILFWQCQTVMAKMLPCHCWYIHCWQWPSSQQWNVRHCWQLNGNDTPNGVYLVTTYQLCVVFMCHAFIIIDIEWVYG